MGFALVGFVLLLVVPVLLAHLLSGMHRSASRYHWLAMEEELSLEPEVAYKTAQVLVAADGSSALLSGVTEGRAYRPDEDAACRRAGCQPPGLDCVCGFYAFRDRREAEGMLGRTLGYYGVRPTALLTVELDGEVLEYERGFRAAHQRVVEVAFTRGCDLPNREDVEQFLVVEVTVSTYVRRVAATA